MIDTDSSTWQDGHLGGQQIFNFMSSNLPSLNAFPYNATEYAYPSITIPLTLITLVSILLNIMLAGYILVRKLYRNFISSHFIVHLCFTSLIGLCFLMPLFLINLWSGENIWADNNLACRVQTFLMSSQWTVVHFMILCISGAHLLTFARIHYNQLFGLPPAYLCVLSWIVAWSICAPCITNGHIVVYDPILRHCVWGSTDYSYKFLTYILLLCVILPSLFSFYAYLKILKILYHSPLVFQSIGLYKSRFLVYAFLVGPLYQIPFYLITMSGTWRFGPDSVIPILSMFFGYAPSLVAPILYGLSLVQMKEEDIALTARAQKTIMNTYHQQVNTSNNV